MPTFSSTNHSESQAEHEVTGSPRRGTLLPSLLAEANSASRPTVKPEAESPRGTCCTVSHQVLAEDGRKKNLETFHKSIVGGIHTNPTLEPSVNSTLATLLGREAALRGRRIAWQELRKDTRRLEPDLTGLASCGDGFSCKWRMNAAASISAGPGRSVSSG